MSEPRAHGHRFGPRDQRGLIPSLCLAQIVTLVLSVVTAVAIARLSTSSHRLVLAVGLVVFALAVSLVRIAGRPLVAWLPEIGAYVSAGVRGRRRTDYRNTFGRSGTRTSRLFGDFSFLDLVEDQRRVGAVLDAAGGTLSAVLEIESDDFSLLDEESRRARVAQWSSVLAAFNADQSLCCLKWIVQSVPDASSRYRASIAQATLAARSVAADEAVAGYADLCERLQRGSLCTEQLVILSTRYSPPRSAKQPSAAAEGETRTFVDFVERVGLAEHRLAEAGLRVRGVYSKRGLIKMIQRRFDLPGVSSDQHTLWPVALEERWESIRTDNLWHATYWIAEWPKTEVSNGFLLPLLEDASIRKSVVLAMTPIHFERATRIAERRRTSSVADAELRRRYGFALSSRIRSQHEAVVQREEELASGHVGYEFSGYVTVSASSADELHRASAALEQSCARSHLEIRRLFGMQRVALLFGFVNARGCQ